MPRPFPLTIMLPATGRGPLYVRLARAVAEDITRGRLRPGDRLPGTRTLAAELRVHRSTVVAAYAELAAQGWTITRPAGATLVAPSSPDGPLADVDRHPSRRPAGMAARAGFPIP